ncbi:hypothetical protein [Sphingomonas sp. AX6]|uniref:hypothetical protein n=1 Tax=Sphingomonas sp. AX6 TaxID=2653171 RepID=UPI0012F2EE02|nr:hypothetical protein [Sphingomonas sp. AX6]VXC63715.1 hypothetical protein SPHINGOAX6_30224 [Sphingomonas sp. AX6]
MTYPRIPGYPGLNDVPTAERPYREIAYQADDKVARIRFVPVVVEPSTPANIPLVPSTPGLMASGSFVDADGQVLTINGRGFVREASSQARGIGDGSDTLDQWLDWIAAQEITEMLRAWDLMTAFADLVPRPVPVIEEREMVEGDIYLPPEAPEEE